jgi:hypothetical protein
MFFKGINNNIRLLMHKVQNYRGLRSASRIIVLWTIAFAPQLYYKPPPSQRGGGEVNATRVYEPC